MGCLSNSGLRGGLRARSAPAKLADIPRFDRHASCSQYEKGETRMNVQELTAVECYAILAETGFGRLACARDNQPYVVPIHFVVDNEVVYAFSLPGQKIDWMRENPRVCLETDSVKGGDDWTSVVVVGRYEELTDTPEHYNERLQALALLQTRPMWWEPGTSAPTREHNRPGYAPIFYRIVVDRVTGYRGLPGAPAHVPLAQTTRSDVVELGSATRGTG